MESADLQDLLQAVQRGELSPQDAMGTLSAWPTQDLGHSQLDLHRSVRCGHPEVVFGAGKTPEELVQIAGGPDRSTRTPIGHAP